MKNQTAVPFVDTNVIPARNAGIGSLLWDLQNPQDPGCDGSPLLEKEFAFIDVGVSRFKVCASLKTLMAGELGMNVEYVATELCEMVPYAHITTRGERGEKIRCYLSGLISSQLALRVVSDWYYVVNGKGKVSSVSYSYNLQGSEVWEAYFMGRSFMVSGEKIEFSDPTFDRLIAPDLAKIESMIDFKGGLDRDSFDLTVVYKIELNPLEAGLTKFGIGLQKTDVPKRIDDKQNVLFLGNVLNNYIKNERSREFHRITADMRDRDIIIIQVDEPEECSINVLQVKVEGEKKTYERLRWVNTHKLEVLKPVRGTDSWQTILLQPRLEQITRRFVDCLSRRVNLQEWCQESFRQLAYPYINQVFRSFFRALPVEATLRIAIREALRRLPLDGGLKGWPVFKNDLRDVYGGALWLNLSPIVSEKDISFLMMAPTNLVQSRVDTSINSAYQCKEHLEKWSEGS